MSPPTPALRPPLVSVILPEREWAALPDKLGDPFFATLAERNLRALAAYDATRGTSLVDVPADLAVPDGARLEWNWRPLKGRILRAALACRLGEVDFALPIARETIAELVRPETWSAQFAGTGARHFDLKVADLISTSLAALEGLAPWLTEEEAGLLVTRIADDGMAAYLRGIEEQEWWTRALFNWAAATHGAAGLGALALARTHPDLSRRALVEADAGLRHLLTVLPEGGWWFEGAMYHTTTLGHLSDFVVGSVLARNDDLGLASNPRFVDALSTRPACLAPDGRLFNFSNCPESPDEWYLPQAYWWAARLGRPEWTAFEDSVVKPWHDASGVFYDVEAFLHRPAFPPSAPVPAPEPLCHFRGLDWVTWRGPSVWAAFRSGFFGGNHNNADLGHFILGRGRTRYLVDPGYGLVHTQMHNAVTVRNQAQTDCATARVTRLTPLGEDGVFLTCDLGAAYPFALAAHRRHLILTEAGGLLVDRITFPKGLPTRIWCAANFQTAHAVTFHDGTARLAGPDGELALVPLTRTRPPALSTQMVERQNDRWTLSRISYEPYPNDGPVLLAWRLDFSGLPSPLEVERLDHEGVEFSAGGTRHRLSWDNEVSPT